MGNIKKFTEEEIKTTKELQYNKLKVLSSSKIDIMNQNKVFEKITSIRNEKEIVDEVTIFPLTKVGVNKKTIDTVNDYIIVFNKYCSKYNIIPKDKIDESRHFEDKFNWINRTHKQIDLFPPMLKKVCKDIISNAPTILTKDLDFHYKEQIIGYFRESNLLEDFLLCSSYAAWESCADFARAYVGQNTPFIYSQTKFDKIVFLFNTKEEAINGENAIARMIVSKFDNQILTHRVYSNDSIDEITIKKGYLNSKFNLLESNFTIDVTSHHRIKHISIKDAYPDISYKGYVGRSTLGKSEATQKLILDENLSTLHKCYKSIDKSVIFK